METLRQDIRDAIRSLTRNRRFVARIKLPKTTYDEAARIRQFFARLRREAAEIPGVQSVGAAETLPLEEYERTYMDASYAMTD